MSEKSEQKAHDYLTSGRVKVIEHTDTSCLIAVEGTGADPYNVIFGNGIWHCSCPARKLCAHVIASRLISPLTNETSGTVKGNPDPEIDALLEGIGTQVKPTMDPAEIDWGFLAGGGATDP